MGDIGDKSKQMFCLMLGIKLRFLKNVQLLSNVLISTNMYFEKMLTFRSQQKSSGQSPNSFTNF